MANLYDPEMEEFTRQQAYADTLRKQAVSGPNGQMVGRVYVPKSGWEAAAEGLVGGFLGGQADAGRKALDQQRQQQARDWMTQRPSATTQQEAQGPMPDGSAMAPIQTPKDYRTQAREMQDWAMKGVDIRHPLAQAMAGQGMQHALTMPEKQAEMEEKAKDRALQYAMVAAAKKEQADRDHSLKLTMQGNQMENARLIAGMNAGNRGANADLDRQLKELRIEQEKKKLTEGTAAEQKIKNAQKARDDQLAEAELYLGKMIGDDETPGLIEQSTGSGIGAGVDYAASLFGKSLPGAQAAARLAPMADTVLKMVPRFEGPQSDKDTASYKQAAGDLANPALPRETRLAAAKELQRIVKERRGQFGVKGQEDVPTSSAASGGVVDFRSLK